MADEVTPVEPAQQTPEPSTEEAPQLPDLDRATLLALLDKHGDDPEFRKEARSRRWVGGIAGEVAQQQRQQERLEAARQAVEAEKQRLKELRVADPMKFAEEIGERMDAEEERRKTAKVRDETRSEFVGKVGDALRDLPEFKELTERDVDDLASSLRGVPDDDVIVVFTKKATDLVAEKRATKRLESTVKQRLAEERKVWEREQAEKRVKERRSPSIRQPSSGNAADDGEPADFYSPEWNAWFERKRKSGQLAGSR